jgi:hypothetical protein
MDGSRWMIGGMALIWLLITILLVLGISCWE